MLKIMKRSFLVVALLILVRPALADDLAGSCEKVRPYWPYKGSIPKTFALIPPCANAETPQNPDSHYSFVGDATISGTIMFQDTFTYGPFATFTADERSREFLPTRAIRFRLDGIDRKVDIVGEFRLPALNGKGKNCWVAPATIRIRRIYVLNNGSDSDGVYLPSYTVVNIGEYRSCKAETDDVPENR